jgi:hypothetical protein
MEYYWSDTDRGEQNYTDENQSSPIASLSVTLHMNCTGKEPGSPHSTSFKCKFLEERL